ncbi:hypothetical protein DITRI_Ditri20bG0050200 [Diplodiscus trichospermus]
MAETNAVAFAGLSAARILVITIANAVLGLEPPFDSDVLANALQLHKKCYCLSSVTLLVEQQDFFIRKILKLIKCQN